ncbi:ribosome small subunit-dependent GTPase A [Bacteriovorax sp. Seq25_V]|uniref:ribosome small subunit-dependent GTPase A n=1 Tax=Bacteriovorax sp. Seq25_V TaxID=1201288 RepID=UPI000389E853|nr:ribosome small subunit-dependent GTPase A [Bacteriovorax sp. Seq25_V]EQC47277.1 ribosome small subunit-dependent GTPase A [Bacteriovorax sp. Seq25_V]
MSSELIKARIIRSHQREFDCKIETDKRIVKATALGNLLKHGDTVVVGDYVLLEESDAGDLIIKEVLERSNEIYRILVRESKKKVTAANCNYLVILNSVAKPKYKRGIVDRFLVRAYQWGLTPLVVFNKMDKYDEDEFDINFEVERLKDLGVECFEISALEQSYEKRFLDKGIKEFKEVLKGKTSLFVGQSGVGKSQTITKLSDGDVVLKTKAVGKAGKGSHTTTWSEIVDCGDFDLIDSPGIRSFSLDDIDPEELIEYFPDIHELSTKCEYSTCTHLPDNKGCVFYIGELEESDLVHSRLESFLFLKDEISSTPFWQKKAKY